MSPPIESFDDIKYKDLMDGLECSEVYLSNLERTARIDAEFYKKENLSIEAILKKTTFYPFADFFAVSDGNHMSISENFQKEGVPYYRGQDIYNVFIEEANPIFIDEKIYEHPHMQRSHLQAGDVLMSIVGAIVGNSAIVSSNEKATCSCKLSIMRTKHNGILPEVMLIYIKTKYGQNQIQKFKRGAAQTGLLLEDFDQLYIPMFGDDFQQIILNIVSIARKSATTANREYFDAQKIFLDSVEYDQEKKSTVIAISKKSFLDSFAITGRLDAEYYQPKYDVLFDILTKVPTKLLGGVNGIVDIMKSIEPGSEAYTDQGIPYVRVSDLSKFEIVHPEIKIKPDIVSNAHKYFPKKDTILFSKDGSVGIAYKVESDMQIITSGALLHLKVRDTREILPDYLALVLNSPIVQLQAERDSNGAIIQHWKPSEVEKVVIPVLDMGIQQKIVDKVQNSFALRKSSKRLIEYAKQAIEMAIEQGEGMASKWIKDKVE